MIPFYPEKIISALPDIISKLPKTLEIVFFTFIFGSILGFLLAKWSLAEGTLKQKAADRYIQIMRCTPPIVLIFLVFYTLPKLIESLLLIDINGWYKGFFVILALALLFAANIAVSFKSAYLAIPKGQIEAGLASGLTPGRTFSRIVLPQIIPIALPNVANNVLMLLKEGTLAYMIGYVDIMGEAQNIISRNLGNYGLETYVAVTIIYWIVALVIEVGALKLEKIFNRHNHQNVGGIV